MKKLIVLFLAFTTLIVFQNFAVTRSIRVSANNIVQGSFLNGTFTTIFISPEVNKIDSEILEPFPTRPDGTSIFLSYLKYNDIEKNDNETYPHDGYDITNSHTISISVTSCEQFQIRITYSDVNVIINFLRLKTPLINGSRLCEGQSGNFTADLQGSFTNIVWSGSGGLSVVANGNAYMSGSTGSIICTASNQCGSRTVIKSMGLLDEGEFGLYGIPYSVNPNESYTLSSLNYSNWATSYGYFNGSPGNQNTQGTQVVYRTTQSPMNVVNVTQSNQCGSATKYIVMNTNGYFGFNQSREDEALLKVFPNPAISTINLQLTETDYISYKQNNVAVPDKIALYNKNGNLVRNVDELGINEILLKGRVIIDVRDLAPDEYFLHITSKKGKVEKVRVFVGDRK